jgi:hypothetical protein
MAQNAVPAFIQKRTHRMSTDNLTLSTDQLENLLSYTNEDIISRFTDMYKVSDEEAEDIFKETRKFLYICRMPGIFIPDDLLIVDEMWHNFILFTREYQRFCNEHFGAYIHHLPASKKEKELQKKINTENPDKASKDFNDKLSLVLSTVYDVFGEDTVIKWFTIYPEKYSKAAITALRKY